MPETINTPQLVRDLTSILYWVIAGMAFYYLRQTPRLPPGSRTNRNLLKITAYGLLIQGLIKMFNLQLWLWSWGRGIATSEGLYSYRWIFQLAFVPMCLLIVFLVIFYYRRAGTFLRRGDYALRTALLLLAVLIGLRTLSYHYFDIIFNAYIGGFMIYWLLEWAAIARVAWTLRRSHQYPFPE